MSSESAQNSTKPIEVAKWWRDIELKGSGEINDLLLCIRLAAGAQTFERIA